MAKNLLKSQFTISNILFLLPLLISLSSAIPSSTICKSTPYPSFCNTILPTTNSSSDVHDYGRFSLRKSLLTASKFLSLIEKYLKNSKNLTITAIRALQDCQFLAQCNIDNLVTSFQIVNKTSQILTVSKADDIQTLLSAILTNTQTCIDGVEATASAWSVRNGISTPIANDTRLYSVSLALFTKGWVPKGRRKQPVKTPKQLKVRNGHLNLKMSARNREIYQSLYNNNNNNRRLLNIPTEHLNSKMPVNNHEIHLTVDDDDNNNRNHNHMKWLELRNGQLNLKMSVENQEFYRTVLNNNNNNNNNRRLLQADDGNNQVLVSDIVIVSQDGSSNFTSINDAVAAAPNNTDGTNGYFLIHITAGVYEEYVSIPKNKKYLMMIGDGINQTIITGNHSVVDGWTTFNSPTFIVVATGFVAVGITFRNTAGAIKHQAVAVRNGADLSTFYSCSFEAYQDTLYVHSLRQFYTECDIYGTVDFIFGNAAVVFQNCNLYPRRPMANQFNAITAQGRTDPNQNTGISIHNCTVRAADDLASSNVTFQTYLGRPWKEYSRTVYMQSFLDNLINPVGWSIWSGDFALNTSYFAEFDNHGPGSDTSQRATWLGIHFIIATDAANFTVSSFLIGDDWIPQSGAPYTGGLI